MLQIVEKLLGGNLSLGGIVAALLAVNSALSVLQSTLGKLQELIPNNPVENKIASVVNVIVGIVKKIIDFLSANQPH